MTWNRSAKHVWRFGLLLWVFGTPSVFGASIGDEIRTGERGPSSENGGFLELGLTVSAGRGIRENVDPDKTNQMELGFGLALSAGYRYNRLFFEASESGVDGLNLGVTVYESERWSIDLLAANIAGEIDTDFEHPGSTGTEAERNDALLERDSLFIAAGSRITGYFGESIAQFRLVSDWYDGNGVLGSARVGRQWQVGNWNLQALGGVRYNSPRFNNYLYGVSAEEQTQRFPAYKAGEAWIPEVELGASIPISEDWVFRSRLQFRQMPGSIKDSPLVAHGETGHLTMGVHYVF